MMYSRERGFRPSFFSRSKGRAVAENLNIVDVLDHIFSEEAKSKRKRAYEKQIQMSGFPIRKTLDDFDFSFQPSIDKRQIVSVSLR